MRKHGVLIGSFVGSAGAVLAFMAGMYLGEQRTLQHVRHALRAREAASSIVKASFESAVEPMPLRPISPPSGMRLDPSAPTY